MGRAAGTQRADNTSYRSLHWLLGWLERLSGDDTTAVVGAINSGTTNLGAGRGSGRTTAERRHLRGPRPAADPVPRCHRCRGQSNDASGSPSRSRSRGRTSSSGNRPSGRRRREQGEAFDDALSPDLAPAAGALPGGTVGTAYSQQFTATNGAGSALHLRHRAYRRAAGRRDRRPAPRRDDQHEHRPLLRHADDGGQLHLPRHRHGQRGRRDDADVHADHRAGGDDDGGDERHARPSPPRRRTSP